MSPIRHIIAWSCSAVGFLGLGPSASANDDVEFRVDGYVDARVIIPADEDRSWLHGGLGKLRFDDVGRSDVQLRAVEAYVDASVLFTSEISAFASIRAEEEQDNAVELMEAYVRYRPVSTDETRWSVKAGGFYPPISLENEETGWSTFWTLTPSAINTWVGEELRTIGVEGKVELRGAIDEFEVAAGLFGWNDPAGVLIDLRGWAIGDRPTGLFEDVRLPGVPIEWTTPMFEELDDRPGYYAGIKWRREGLGTLQVLRYDNRGELDATVLAWPQLWVTDFWSFGGEAEIAGITLLGQVLFGETDWLPDPAFFRTTAFRSAYVLVGWDGGDWRIAARADVFATEATEVFDFGFGPVTQESRSSEHGHAFTLSGTWVPVECLRLTSEALFIHSNRAEREFYGVPRKADEFQFQQSARFVF
jgi:hypothetical protein